MKVATWNVNSIRARLDRLLNWLAKESPDILCLQELKVEPAAFPFDEIQAAGYQSEIHSQRTYNGVAILSRMTIENVQKGWSEGADDPQARLIEGTVDGVRVLSVYVPNGNVVGSDKWLYKMDWIARMRAYMDQNLDPEEKVVLCGDFNVAPALEDVARPEQWKESVLFHPDARRALAQLTDWGFVDTLRLHHDGPGPYSWWDYRQLGFPRNNGLRIDHVFATLSLSRHCVDAYVDRDERKGQKPSDHAPVVAVFE